MSDLVPFLELRGVSKSFPGKRSLVDLAMGRPARSLQAVRDASLRLAPAETLGVVGESGCGKSTLGGCITGLIEPTAGEVLYKGAAFASRRRRERSRIIQMIFQDPYSSLNPRLTLAQTLDEVLRVHGLRAGAAERRDRIDELLLMVNLAPSFKDRLPHAFSGGQRQRISIARALAVEPQIIVADEPVSALDASVQAQIVNLFVELRDRLGLSYIFVAHDLNVVRHVSHRIAVMYLGEIVECADADLLFEDARHPYARADHGDSATEPGATDGIGEPRRRTPRSFVAASRLQLLDALPARGRAVPNGKSDDPKGRGPGRAVSPGGRNRRRQPARLTRASQTRKEDIR